MKKNPLILAVTCLILNGCSNESDEAPKASAESPNKTSLFKDQIQALEKAKGIEQQAVDAESKRRQMLDDL